MIKRYSDHAANERTFLAWVRTAIAVMAFGFVIERFGLFLQAVAPQLSQRQFSAHSQAFANFAGLAFIAIGVTVVALACFRFIRTGKDIDSEQEVAGPGARFDVALTWLIGRLRAGQASQPIAAADRDHFGAGGPRPFRRAVVGTAVDDDNARDDIARQFGDNGADRFGFIEGRNDDRKIVIHPAGNLRAGERSLQAWSP